nr:putative ribonuclease H-like domain-containing protein [Tanacetum cinerariifolium]
MNYVPVVDAGTNSTNFSGTKDAAGQEVKKDVSTLRYIALPNWAYDAFLESSSSKSQDDCNTDVPESSGNINPTATSTIPPANQVETLTVESLIPTANILGVTTNLKESNGVEADVSNMETTIIASLTPTLRIHRDHPKSQIIGPVDTPIQTKNKFKEKLCRKSFFNSKFRWVLKNKKDEREIVTGNKARIVAQRHTQEERIDYDEVFAPVARIEAIRLFLAYASFMGFTMYQMDVKSAFLYDTIDEEVYVMQPLEFQDPEYPAKVYKVKKAMYGLHQAPRAWYCTLSKYLLTNGFQRDLQILPWTRRILKERTVLEKMHQVTPKECHLHAVKRIFQYLRGHPKLGLWYPKDSPFDLVAYSDSDYGGATQDRKSTTRGCQFLGRRLISWQCKKKTIVATSTTEAKYLTAAS